MDGSEVVAEETYRATPDLLDRTRLEQAIVSQDEESIFGVNGGPDRVQTRVTALHRERLIRIPFAGRDEWVRAA